MSYIVSENILDEPIPTSFKSSTMIPTPVGFALQKLKEFSNWIISYIPEPIKRTASDKLKTLKETISKIFYDNDKTPKEIETALKGTVKTFRIKGGSNSGKSHQHYTLIKNMSRLVGMQTNKHNGKTHICLNCFNTFSLEKSFKEHTEVCLTNDSVKIEMPKKGSCIEFDKHAKKLKVPFVIYADFESYTEHIPEGRGSAVQQSCDTNDEASPYTKKYSKAYAQWILLLHHVPRWNV